MALIKVQSIQLLFYYITEEFIRGNPLDTANHVCWDKVVLNLIVNSDFNPILPNVYKWDGSFNRIVGDLVTYVDDLRAIEFLWNMHGG